MNSRILPIVLLGVGLCSCDKARSLVSKARSAVESEIAKGSGAAAEAKPDPELLKLVDQAPEGVLFRKDLPFPKGLDVKITRRLEISGRSFESSALGNAAAVIKGTQTNVIRCERAGDQVRYTLAESTFAEPVAEGAGDDKKPVVRQLAPASTPRTFKRSGSSWTASEGEGFRAAALSKQLSPVFDQLLIENSLSPRPLWFGKHRHKIGEKIPVTGDTLPMLLTGKAKGSFTLTLESIGSVNGHPCGVFTITGDYSRRQFPDFEGHLSDEDVTIQSGKIWLSLLHPLVLKEEYDTIQTTRSGSGANPASRLQGSVKVTVTRDWKPTGG